MYVLLTYHNVGREHACAPLIFELRPQSHFLFFPVRVRTFCCTAAKIEGGLAGLWLGAVSFAFRREFRT